MRVKDITFAMKKGQPNFGSVSAGMTVEISDGESLDKAWDFMKTEVEKQCSTDASWIDKKQPNEEVKHV